MADLDLAEKRAIATLTRLAKRWPKTLWLFAGDGSLHVMRCLPDGGRAMTRYGTVDAEHSVIRIHIPADGGGW